MDATHEVYAYDDGSIMTRAWADAHNLVFTRFDASGMPVWRRSIFIGDQAGGSPPTASTPDGGFIIATTRTTSLPDSILFDLVKFTAAGTTEWTRSLLFDESWMPLGVDCKISCSPSGELFLVTSAFGLSSISKLAPNGTELWTRRVWDLDIGDAFELVIQAEPLPDGGCVFLGTGIGGLTGPAFGLGRSDAAGNILWIKSLTYNVTNADFSHPELVRGPQGNIAVIGPLTVFGMGGYVFAARIDTTGQLIRADIYQNDPMASWYFFVSAERSSSEGLLFSGGTPDFGNALAFAVDQNGVLLESMQCQTMSIGTVEHQIRHWACKMSQDSIYWTGDLVLRDIIFGTEQRWPTLWKSGPALTGFCATDTFTLEHLEVPPGLITSEDVGNDSLVTYPSFTFPITNSLIALPTISSYCSLVGVPEVQSLNSFTATPNPVASGGSFRLLTQDQGDLEMMDAFGRIVDRVLLEQGESRLSCPEVPGTYLLRFRTQQDASRPILQRLIVR